MLRLQAGQCGAKLRVMFDVEHIIQAWGLLAIVLIVFIESGLLVGFFLPGDTLLFGAGLAASQGQFSIFWLITLVIIAAVAGDNVGYGIGRRLGPRLFKKKDSILFRHEHLARAEKFYKRHGGKTIILARFTPIVRTFAPVVAGASKMPRARFFSFNIIGGVAWGAGMPLLGYWVGNKIPGLDKYIEIVLLGVVVVSIALGLFHILKDKDTRIKVWQKIKLGLQNIALNKKID